MQSSLADLLDAWHDFDLLIGTAAATLVGLMFVAASIGASVFLEKDRAAMKAFISPTVVHFSAVLVTAMVSLIPSHDWPALAGLLALVGIPGAVYSANLWLQLFVRRRFPAVNMARPRVRRFRDSSEIPSFHRGDVRHYCRA